LMFGELPPGVQFSLTGLLLIAIFTSRLAFGIATLPLALSGGHALQSENSESWRRLQLLIWFLVSLAFLPVALLSFLTIGVPFLLTSRLPSFVQSDLFPRLSVIPATIVVLGIALCIMGREGREAVQNSIRLPDLRWPLLALVFPIGIDLFISTGQYILDRVQWAASDFGKFAPPQFGSYFNVPTRTAALFRFESMDAQGPARSSNSRSVFVSPARALSGGIATGGSSWCFRDECISFPRGVLERRLSRVRSKSIEASSIERIDEPVGCGEPATRSGNPDALGASPGQKGARERTSFLQV
jgi:hypothetical protein